MRHLITLFALCLLFCSSPRVPAADNVYGTITGWGQMVDPDGDCHFKVGQNAVTIGFSGSIQALDAETGRMNAPRVVRSLGGDFSVQVTVDGNLPLPDDENATAYVSGGLVMLQDDRSYLRIERASFSRADTVNHYANFEQRIDGKRTRMGRFADFPLQNDKPVDLRVEVKEGTVRALARHEGQKWHEMGVAKVNASATFLVGVSGVNTSQQPIEVTFRNYQFGQADKEAEAESSSGLDLTSPPKLAEPNRLNSETTKFYSGLMALQQRAKEIGEMDNDARQNLIDDAMKLVVDSDAAVSMRFTPTLVAGLSRAFLAAGDGDRAIAIYDQFIEVLTGSDDNSMNSLVKHLEAARDSAKFKRDLIGKPISLEGKTLASDDFNWSKYEGKVVLVDFWASWCGPCRREIPNILTQYKKYHDQGFEVVGICLDTDREKAEKYVADAELAWPSLFEDDAGWKHPMALRYKIHAIPTAILVDRDGNVVSLAARGEELERLLAKQSPETGGEAEQSAAEPAANTKKSEAVE